MSKLNKLIKSKTTDAIPLDEVSYFWDFFVDLDELMEQKRVIIDRFETIADRCGRDFEIKDFQVYYSSELCALTLKGSAVLLPGREVEIEVPEGSFGFSSDSQLI